MRKWFVFSFVILLGLTFVSAQNFLGTSSQGTASFVKYTSQPDFQNYYNSESRLSTYWPTLNDPSQCQTRQDILLQVAPFGCQPAVVRSDLLAEQNVPVFCQLDALRVNPLIDVTQIRNIRFTGTYPKEVVGVGFHPALASLRTSNELLGSPFMNNIGYAVVVLKKNADEKTIPSFINLTLKASFDYYADNSFGIGKSEFLLHPVSDDQWKTERFSQSFMNGQFTLRLEDANPERASVAIYSGDRKIATATARLGQSSSDIYLPGLYCQAAVVLKYDSLVAAETSARLQVGADTIDVFEGSQFLNSKCAVRSIKVNGTTGKSVTIDCSGSNSFTLSLAPSSLVVGDQVFVEGQTGTWTIQKITKSSEGLISYELRSLSGTQSTTARSDQVSSVDNKKVSESRLDNSTESYFKNAVDYYSQVANDYTLERAARSSVSDSASLETYGEQSLSNAIDLAKKLGKYQTAITLMENYLQLYGDENSAAHYNQEINKLKQYDSRLISNTVSVNNELTSISLVDVREPTEKPSASVSFGGARTTAFTNQIVSIGSGTRLTINSIEPTRIRGTVTCPAEGSSGSRTQQVTLALTNAQADRTISVCDGTLRLEDISAELYARVRLEAATRAPTISTNVTIGVGIEKRAIKLTPDKTQERIETLNATIKKWEQVSTNLGNVVKTMKAACFATAGVLTVKNFVTGLSGEALARQQVMRGEDGWTEWCRDAVSQGTYATIGQCYSDNSDRIDADVDRVGALIDQQNQRVQTVERTHTSNQGLLSGSVDTEGARDALVSQYSDSTKQQSIQLLDGTSIRVSDLTQKSNNVSYVSYQEARDIELQTRILQDSQSSEVTKESARKELQQLATTIQERRQLTEERGSWARSAGTPVEFFTSRDSVQAKYYGQTLAEKNYGLPIGTGTDQYASNTPVQVISVTQNGVGTPYLAVLQEGSGGNYQATKFYKLQTNADGTLGNVADTGTTQLSGASGQRIGVFSKVDRASCLNKFVGTPEVQYYETEPYKGMPAIVPVDTEQGWYVGTRQTIPALGGVKAFQSSGRPVSFWICNVGPDGQPDFFVSGFDDDICQQFNYETGQALDQFSCLSAQETTRLVQRSRAALEDAANRYSSSSTGSVNINGNRVKVGTPAVNIPGTQCQDFMSPDDCKLLFNVCDPVICPSSRCDLGGAYPVNDVVQTGIIGSTLLCLPNAREGIFIPVCLTGIQAGVDSYLSILKSHQQCLQENLATGKYVGICDEVTSVYMCEFFWRQASPLAKLLAPKAVELLYGQGQARGGGEYRTVQSAWDNSQASVNYFTQTYGANAFEAFNVRSIEEAGSTFCRAFVSAKAPTSFETLIEPQSPPQFYAWFSTIPFSDATLPATAQYKVFYHIFAGNDAGVYYSVYLKDPPQTSYYQSTPYITVANGFITQGQQETQSKDFTAPVGYQQLCVRINDEEQCGFKEVTTDFALNYVSDKVIADELAQEDITTENACISGTVNPSALLNLNPQQAAQEAIDPAVYQRGISRICATSNPGLSTDPTRFKAVGYCDDRRVTCWLDKQSIDNSLSESAVGLRNQTLSEFDASVRAELIASEQYLSQDSGDEQLSVIQQELDSLSEKNHDLPSTEANIRPQLSTLSQLSEKLIFNHQKARALFLYGKAHDILTRASYDQLDGTRGGPDTIRGPNVSISSTTVSSGSDSSTVQVSESTRMWTYSSAIAELQRYPSSNSYSSHKAVIDQFYSDGLLSASEYKEINGNGVWNLEEDLDFVVEVLSSKLPAASSSSSSGTSTDAVPVEPVSLSEPYDPAVKQYILFSGEIGEKKIYLLNSKIFCESCSASGSDVQVGVLTTLVTNEYRTSLLVNPSRQFIPEYISLLDKKTIVKGSKDILNVENR